MIYKNTNQDSKSVLSFRKPY